MSRQNQVPMYPKVTQEQVLSVAQIILSALQDPKYLRESTYSSLMQQTISVEVEKVKKLFEKGKVILSDSDLVTQPIAPSQPVVDPNSGYLNTKTLDDNRFNRVVKQSDIDRAVRETEKRMKDELAKEWEKLRNYKDERALVAEDAEIRKNFSSLSENLDQRTEEYRDQFGILIRIEKIIRSIEKIAKSDSTASAKLSATTKLMDYQEQQMSILERLLKLEKVNRIESITRKFFLELRKHPELSVVADRYLHLLNEIE